MVYPKSGAKIVLTASAAEISQYGGEAFKAFTCTFPYKLTKSLKQFQVPERNKDGSSKFAPFGLRVVESILADRFGEENVVVCHPYDLDEFVGPKTKAVGISTMDPAGLGYVSVTYNSIIGVGGVAHDAASFEELLESPVLYRHTPKVIVGGQGAWQISDAGLDEKFRIDTLVDGQGTNEIIHIFDAALKGEKLPKSVTTEKPDYEHVPLIKGAACYGAVEITRGCGRGCKFCGPTAHGYVRSFPLEHIMKNVATNVKNGSDMIFTVGEDTFLYGASAANGFKPNTKAVVQLYKSIAEYPGVKKVHLSHASLAPVLHDEKLLEQLTPILIEKSGRTLNGHSYITVEVGVESGSTRIMNMYNKGKAMPFKVDEWPELVKEGLKLMNDYEWNPLITIITGWPDETEDDNLATLQLIDDLKGYKIFIVPNLFIPLKEASLRNERRMDLRNLSETQWEIIASAWTHNVNTWADNDTYKTYARFAKVGAICLAPYILKKHGSKALKPVLNFAIGRKALKRCDPNHCKD